MLVDGDEAGHEFIKLNNEAPNQLKILSLTDVNDKFIEIENLFSDEDKNKFNVSEKDTGLSIIFKKIICKHPEEVSDTTKDNFMQLFKAIQKQFLHNDDESAKSSIEVAKIN